MKYTAFASMVFAFVNASNKFTSGSKAVDLLDDDDYSAWLNSMSYHKSLFLETNVGSDVQVGLFWTIKEDSIHMAVACPSSGWCGFGIAEAGGMKGSDMVVFETETNELFDAHVLGAVSAGPMRDSCQNWHLTNSLLSSQVTLFEAHRLLDTEDTFDRPIIDDSNLNVPPTRIIVAWGESTTVSYHGNNRLRHSVRFFGKETDDEISFKNSMEEEAEGSFELRAVDFPVPQQETFYGAFCFSYADLIKKGVPEAVDLHMIGIEPIIDHDAVAHVHHFVLTASFEPQNDMNISATQEQCQNDSMTEMAYVWAPGEGSFAYPNEVGGPLGINGYQSFKLEIHYNNPNLREGILDSSGIKVYFTSKKRDNDLGILQLGDPFVALANESLGDGMTSHTFLCPSSCSSVSVSQPLTVIREYHHMHRSGQRMYTEQIRDGELVRTGSVDFWDFDQNGNLALQQPPFEILPGDSFRTRCYFTAKDEVWGLGSQDEMCISFLSYYPRQVVQNFPYTCGVGFADFFPECNALYTSEVYSSTDEFQRSFGGTGGVCKDMVPDDSNASGSVKYNVVFSVILFIFIIVG